MVRQRSKTGQGKAKRCLSRKDSTGSLVENPTGKDEGKVEIPVQISVPALGIRVASVEVFTASMGDNFGCRRDEKKPQKSMCLVVN